MTEDQAYFARVLRDRARRIVKHFAKRFRAYRAARTRRPPLAVRVLSSLLVHSVEALVLSPPSFLQARCVGLCGAGLRIHLLKVFFNLINYCCFVQ